MLKYLGTIVATAIVVLFLLVSSVPLMHWFREEGRLSTLDDSRERWAALGLVSYRFTVDVERAAAPNGALDIRVVDGQAAPAKAGVWPDASRYPTTIGALFDWVDGAIAAAPDVFEVSYDDDYGFPRRVFVDPDAGTAGDETRITVSGFDPRVASDGRPGPEPFQ